MSRSFDADTERVDYGTFSTTGEDISVFCWLQIDSLSSSDRRFFQKGSSGAEDDIDWMLSNTGTTTTLRGRTRLRRNNNTDTFLWTGTQASIPTGWVHMGFRYDGSANSGSNHFNGVTQGGAFSHTETTGNISQRSNAVQFGNNDGSNNAFFGQGAWFCVWDAYLSAEEVTALAAGVHPYRTRPDKILLASPMWGLQSPEIDLSPNGNSGTVTGATLGTTGPPVEPFLLSSPVFEDVVAAPPAGIIPLIMHHRKLLGV